RRRVRAGRIASQAPRSSRIASRSIRADGLRETDAKSGNEYSLSRCLAIIQDAESTPDHGLAIAEQFAGKAGRARRVPGERSPWRKGLPIRIEQWPVGFIDRHKAEVRVVYLSLFGRLPAGVQEATGGDEFSGIRIGL